MGVSRRGPEGGSQNKFAGSEKSNDKVFRQLSNDVKGFDTDCSNFGNKCDDLVKNAKSLKRDEILQEYHDVFIKEMSSLREKRDEIAGACQLQGAATNERRFYELTETLNIVVDRAFAKYNSMKSKLRL